MKAKTGLSREQVWEVAHTAARLLAKQRTPGKKKEKARIACQAMATALKMGSSDRYGH